MAAIIATGLPKMTAMMMLATVLTIPMNLSNPFLFRLSLRKLCSVRSMLGRLA